MKLPTSALLLSLPILLLAISGSLGVAACSSDNFAGDDGGSDVASDVTSDVPDTAAPGCAFDGVFQLISPAVSLNSTFTDFHLALDEQELNAVLARVSRPDPDAGTDGGGLAPELWKATRTTTSAAFAPVRATELNTGGTLALDPSLSRDGLTIYFSASRGGNGGIDIYTATRSTSTAPFGTPQLVTALSSVEDERSPYLVDGRAIYFARSTGGNFDLYRAARVNAQFDPPTRIDELTGPTDEREPVVSDDELTIYFTRRGTPTEDIYVAHRASTAQPFGSPKLVAGLIADAGIASLRPTWISRDQCVLYFTNGGDLYRAVRFP